MNLLRFGILFSTTGAYGALGRDCRDGAELAVEHLSDEGAHAFTVEPVFGDPAGCADRYITMARAVAVAHLSDEGAHAFTVEPVFGDPAGCADRYITMARAMMRDNGCRHIVGAVTSQARKDVIPIVEKHDGQLWYVCPYEGFEANENVIYTGACPNQH